MHLFIFSQFLKHTAARKQLVWRRRETLTLPVISCPTERQPMTSWQHRQKRIVASDACPGAGSFYPSRTGDRGKRSKPRWPLLSPSAMLKEENREEREEGISAGISLATSACTKHLTCNCNYSREPTCAGLFLLQYRQMTRGHFLS